MGANCRFVQYMGAWAFDAKAGAWVFARAVMPDGTTYPPVRVLPAGQALFRRSNQVIGTYPVPVDCDWSTPFLERVSVRVSEGVTVSPPGSDTDTGSVSQTTRAIVFFTNDSRANEETEELLSIQVAEANDATAYDSAGANGGNE